MDKDIIFPDTATCEDCCGTGLKSGFLLEHLKPEDRDKYMLMFGKKTDENHVTIAFKHIDTREYLYVKAFFHPEQWES